MASLGTKLAHTKIAGTKIAGTKIAKSKVSEVAERQKLLEIQMSAFDQRRRTVENVPET
jgi:hypothetical protein